MFVLAPRWGLVYDAMRSRGLRPWLPTLRPFGANGEWRTANEDAEQWRES